MEAFAFIIIASLCVVTTIEANVTSEELAQRSRRAAKAKSNPQCEGLYYPLPAFCFVVQDPGNSSSTTTTEAIPTIEISYPIPQPIAIPIGYPIPYPYFLASPVAPMPVAVSLPRHVKERAKDRIQDDHLMPPDDAADSNDMETKTMKPEHIKIDVKIIEDA